MNLGPLLLASKLSAPQRWSCVRSETWLGVPSFFLCQLCQIRFLASKTCATKKSILLFTAILGVHAMQSINSHIDCVDVAGGISFTFCVAIKLWLMFQKYSYFHPSAPHFLNSFHFLDQQSLNIVIFSSPGPLTRGIGGIISPLGTFSKAAKISKISGKGLQPTFEVFLFRTRLKPNRV